MASLLDSVQICFPGEGSAGVNVEEQREIGHQARCDNFHQLLDAFSANISGDALVGDRRIGKPLGDHDVSTLECGVDDFVNVLPAIRGKQEYLGKKREIELIMNQDSPQFLTQQCPSRLERMCNRQVVVQKVPFKPFGLGALSASIDSFKR